MNTAQKNTTARLLRQYDSIAESYDANLGYWVVVFYDHEYAQWEYMLNPAGQPTGTPRQIWC